MKIPLTFSISLYFSLQVTFAVKQTWTTWKIKVLLLKSYVWKLVNIGKFWCMDKNILLETGVKKIKYCVALQHCSAVHHNSHIKHNQIIKTYCWSLNEANSDKLLSDETAVQVE